MIRLIDTVGLIQGIEFLVICFQVGVAKIKWVIFDILVSARGYNSIELSMMLH